MHCLEKAAPPCSEGLPHLTDLKFGSLLGEGAFARVLHATDVRNGRDYAVKIVEKRQVQVQDRKSSVLVEKDMLLSLDHPGIVRLHWAFQDRWSLYFVLEHVPGGELSTQIARMGTCPLDFAQYYAAQIVAILAYLRACRVAHRDLKPENLLLTTEGHLKLVDFDAAIRVPDEGEGDAAAGCQQDQSSFVGTSLYLPPEVLLGNARPQEAFALDLWALGCIIFLMLVGETPFHAAVEYQAFQRILQGDYAFPPGFPHRMARELVDAFLAPRPAARPGQGPSGLAEVECHAFFGGSTAAFQQIRHRQPPLRVERSMARAGFGVSRLEGAADPPLSGSPLDSFDFASSAECTPEVGESFLARVSAFVPVAPCPFSANEASPRAEEGAAAAHPGLRAPGHLPGRSAAAPVPVGSPRLWQGSPVPPGRAADALAAEPRWQAVADLPGRSWRHWLQQLVKQQTLVDGERVAIVGSIVQRRLPCLRPKVLVLTDMPRLLVMDSSGLGLLHDIDLVDARAAPSINVRSPVDFVLDAGGRQFLCSDQHLGAEAWSSELQRARARLTH